MCPCGAGLALRCIDSRQTKQPGAASTADRLARFAARGLVVQVHVHLAAVFDRRGRVTLNSGCVAAEATTDGVGDDTWLGLGLGLGFRDRDRGYGWGMVRVRLEGLELVYTLQLK
mgnify:FL=1